MHSLVTCSLSCFLLGSVPCLAMCSNFSATIFGATIDILDLKNGVCSLLVNRTQSISAGVIEISEIEARSEYRYIIGYAGSGGNVCDLSPFIISFPNSAPARVDGPIESCNKTDIEMKSDSIIVRETAATGDKKDIWTWTPSYGFKKESVIQQPENIVGWNELRSRTVKSSSDILDSNELSSVIFSTIEANDKDIYNRLLKYGVGSVEWNGNYSIISSCEKGLCSDFSQITVLDIVNRSAFIAVKPHGERIRVYPNVKSWPSIARSALKAWASRWN